MADLTAAANNNADDQRASASATDVGSAERTRIFFERNLEARRKLNLHTKKQDEKRMKLRKEFGKDAYLFDRWRGEQSASLDLSNVSREPRRTHSEDSLLATRVEAVRISESSSDATCNTAHGAMPTLGETADKLEKSEE